jgi:hypothetical protein
VVRATMIGVLVSALIPGRFGEPARAYLVARRAGDTARRFPRSFSAQSLLRR